MKRAIRKCCGTCKHWGKPGDDDVYRLCMAGRAGLRSMRDGKYCDAWDAKRPARRPAPFRRWSRNGSMLLFDGAVELLAFYEDISGHVDPDAVVRALNKHRVVLPKGIRK